MLLYVDYGDEVTEEWTRVTTLESAQGGTPDAPTHSMEGEAVLPSGTRLKIGAAYTPWNLGANIVVFIGDQQVLSVFGGKLKATSYGPTVLFVAPCGTNVQLMLGKYEG